ncbi:hypothetical protein WKH54_02855 [Priestia megaterium]|uniref:hypothetical protein n=1 Tax=Priestia TaxID=2800373 RepID=UPI00203A49BA|nr:hypothetical protein [Priestia aryabhattai]MCM3769592.1 hypothetical protein [Priestia aryabhattai]
MANNKYTKDDLYQVARIVKRTLRNQFSKGSRSKITKNEVFDMIYPKLGLSSRRSLWKSPYIDYLNTWYSQLEEEVKELKKESERFEELYAKQRNKKVEDFARALEQKEKYISLLEERIKELSNENEELRIAYMGKYTKIDLEKKTEFPF